MDPCKNQSAHPHEAVEAPWDCLAVGSGSAAPSPAVPGDSDWGHTVSDSNATSPPCNLFHTKLLLSGREAIICNENPVQPSEVRYEHHDWWCSPRHGVFLWTSMGMCWKTPPCFSVPVPPHLSHQEWKQGPLTATKLLADVASQHTASFLPLGSANGWEQAGLRGAGRGQAMH